MTSLTASALAEDEAQPLEAITPTKEAINVGFAGEDPADIARYLLARGVQGIAMSPDGKSLAMRLSVTGTPQLWIKELCCGPARQLTFGNGITFFRWLPDSSALVYGADNDGNEQPSFSMISVSGANEREILGAVAGGFRQFGEISADGKTFSFASTERNGLDFDIYLGEIETGKTKRVYKAKGGYFIRAMSPDAKRIILAQAVGEDGDNLYVLDTKRKKIEPISVPSPRANHSDGGIRWTQDGRSLFLATNRGREFSALEQYDFNTKTFTTLIEADVDVGDIHLCGDNDKYLSWTTNHDGFERIHVMDRQSNQLVVTDTGLLEGPVSISCNKESALTSVLLNSWEKPGYAYTWDIETGETLSLHEPTLAGLSRFVKPLPLSMPARDGVTLHGLLYLPNESSLKPGELPPVVFEVHGGPTAQSTPRFNGSIQYLVDRGIAVFQPNVRGSTGFGRTYATLDDREKRTDSVRDLIDMLDFLREDGRVDVERAAVSGGSYGGYMVNAVLALYPGAFKAGVSRYGVADWVTALEVASPGLKATDIIEYGDINDAKWRAFYAENSPINFADRITVPVLFSHGEMDPRIDIAETETMVRVLRKNGVEAPFIRIPDEGHGWRKLSNQLFYYRRQAAFLEEKLKAHAVDD